MNESLFSGGILYLLNVFCSASKGQIIKFKCRIAGDGSSQFLRVRRGTWIYLKVSYFVGDCSTGKKTVRRSMDRFNQQPMKLQQLNKTNLTLLILGILVLSSSFVVKRYTLLSDAGDGFLKGISIGLLVQSVILIFQQRKRQAEL